MEKYQIKRSLVATTAIVAFFLAMNGANAQQLSDEEIENALQIMRDNGVPEAKIEQNRQAFKKMQAALVESAAITAEANKKAAPIPDYQQQRRDKFEREFGDAPEASVAFKGQTYRLKVTNCTSGKGWYVIDAKAAPDMPSAILSAVKNSSSDGSFYVSIDFQAGDYRATQTLGDALFDGETFEYSGLIDVLQTGGAVKDEISITAACE